MAKNFGQALPARRMERAIEDVARRACLAAGTILRERFESGTVAADRTAHDVKDEADELAEAEILDVVRAEFPDHAIYTEEAGSLRTDGEYRWVIDPLDGTNNFVSGIPTFGSAIAVLDEDGPVLGVVYVPITDGLYIARRDEGVVYDGTRVTANSPVAPSHATVGYVIGREVKHDEREKAASRLYDALDDATKRVVASWSPVVHWGLLARGRLEAMVAFHANEEERYVGELFAREAGASIKRDGPLFVAATNEETSDTLFEAATAAVG